jgi:two-component system chemotaxis response regulator CheB
MYIRLSFGKRGLQMAFEGIKVFIVEDSDFYRAFLEKILQGDGSFNVCGYASMGKEAIEAISRVNPDVIILDLQLPDVNRFELLESITDRYDIPILVVSSMADESIRALELGAADFLTKDTSAFAEDRHKFTTMLTIKLKVLAGVHMKRCTPRTEELGLAALKKQQVVPEPGPVFSTRGKASTRIIAMGASLGGIEATLELLQGLSPELPGMVLVQHMPPGFTKSYAERLNKITRFRVEEVTRSQLIEDGSVLVASGGRQLQVNKTAAGYVAESVVGPQVNGFCPSVDVLFKSVARAAGPKAVGVIMTGIGTDGALGLKAMHDAGAHTWGQSPESCVVYGMPAAAQKAGAVDEEKDLAGIGAGLTAYFNNYRKDTKEE